MLKATEELLTANDYREMPEGPPYFQLVEGRLYMAPSPDFFHQTVALNVATIIRQHLRHHPLGKAAIAPSDVQFDFMNVHQPDVYFISNERLHILTKQGPVGAPDLVVEVLSKSTAKLDKGTKLRVYSRSGVKELWLVDKDKREVVVYRFAESITMPVATYRGRQKFATALLPGLKISVPEIFQE
ncbi:MAG: Uma2 family endonuclease [Verrucomicrobia bacterium]|nr:Uma2 family endonuclease [Verrucomicrobiota bacterium]